MHSISCCDWRCSSYLSVSVSNAVIHQHRHQDRDGNAKVTDDSSGLWKIEKPKHESHGDAHLDSTEHPETPEFKVFTLPPRKRLFLNFLRKKATKKVPIMRTRDRRAVLGWLNIWSNCWNLALTVVSVGYIAISGCSWNTWKQEERLSLPSVDWLWFRRIWKMIWSNSWMLSI